MKTLVIFSFVMIYFQSTLGDWEHPHYSFRCLESTGIEIFGFHENSKVTISKGNNTDDCAPKKIRIGLFRIPYNCTQKIKNDTKITGFEVGIHVVDPEFDMTSSTINPNITGGHNGHNFNIKCFNIPDHGVNRTVAKVFQGGAHELPVNNKEVSSVDMHFRATEDINAPDISEIYIGDAFYMFLEYTGISKYKIIPKTCTAYEGTVVPVHGQPNVNKVELWDGKKNGKKCTVHEELLASIDNYHEENRTIAAKMYGFRFEGSEYITIACEVGVFREDSPKPICPFQRRKRETRLTRRDVLDTAIHRKNIIGKLRIIDHPSEYGNSASKSGGSFERIMFSWGILILSSRFTVLW